MFNQHRTRTRAIQGVIDISTSGALKYPSLIVSEDTRLNSMMKYNPQNEMFDNRKTKRCIFKTKRIFSVSPPFIKTM